LTETIGEEIKVGIAETLSPKGHGASPLELWNAVRKGAEINSPRYHRYRSILSELLRTRQIAARKEDDKVKEFVWIGKPYEYRKNAETLPCTELE
jgi:hypothetical protein